MPADTRRALLVEDAVDQVKDHLRAVLNQSLMMIAQQYLDAGDSFKIALERIPDNKYYVTEAIHPLQPPAIAIIAEQTEHDLDAQNFASQRHALTVVALVEGIEATTLTRKAFRYARALWYVLHDAVVGNCVVLVRRVTYSPIYTSGEFATESGAGGDRKFRKDIMLTLDVIHTEPF
jgi:hypothetical protein